LSNIPCRASHDVLVIFVGTFGNVAAGAHRRMFGHSSGLRYGSVGSGAEIRIARTALNAPMMGIRDKFNVGHCPLQNGLAERLIGSSDLPRRSTSSRKSDEVLGQV
jgi:hypothetical protein